MIYLIIGIITFLILCKYNAYKISSLCLMIPMLAMLVTNIIPFPSQTIYKTKNPSQIGRAIIDNELSYFWITNSTLYYAPEEKVSYTNSNTTSITSYTKDYPLWVDILIFPLTTLENNTPYHYELKGEIQ